MTIHNVSVGFEAGVNWYNFYQKLPSVLSTHCKLILTNLNLHLLQQRLFRD